MNDKPKIRIPLQLSDWIVEIIGAAFLLSMISVTLYYFNDLPERIPTHFNAAGEPDGFGQKDTLWTLPIIGTVLYIGMNILNRYPHVFNYPKAITAENAERQYRLATRLVRILNMLIVASFFYIGYSTIQTSLNNQTGLGTYSIVFFLVFIFGTIGFYMYRSLTDR